jgi:hypothetical protein
LDKKELFNAPSNIIGQKRILEIPPQKPHFAMQIKSGIFPGKVIIVEAGSDC